MRKLYKIAVLVMIGLIMTSCSSVPPMPKNDFQTFIFNEFQKEENRMINEEINPKLEQLEAKIEPNQRKIQETFDRIASVNELYLIQGEDLLDSATVENIRQQLFRARFNYSDPKGTYSVQFDPFDGDGINPVDSSDLKKYIQLFDKVSRTDLPVELRKLYVSEMIRHTLVYFKEELTLPYFSFNQIEFGVNAPHKIWFQDEKAFITVGYYEDFHESYEVEMANQVFDKRPVQFNLPNEKGLVTYQGKLKIREAGREVWRAFELRFFVE